MKKTIIKITLALTLLLPFACKKKDTTPNPPSTTSTTGGGTTGAAGSFT